MKEKKKEMLALQKAEETTAEKVDETEFSDSISDALKQKNEKNFLLGITALLVVITLLVFGALSNLLTLSFEVNRIFGYAMCALAALAVLILIVRPVCKVLSARYFITDVTNENKKKAKKRNARALKKVASALVEYNEDPKNARFRYLSAERTHALKKSLAHGNQKEIRKELKKAYAGDVGSFANSVIFKSAGRAFLTTSVSQNDKIDALSTLLINLSLVKQVVGIYGYRPSFSKLFRVYLTVLKTSLVAYGMQNVNWFNVFSKFFSGVAKKIPFLDTVVDSTVQGTVSAFLTLLVGYKTKKYLCSDYKKQEKIAGDDEIGVADDEVKIAASLAKEIRLKNEKKAQA